MRFDLKGGGNIATKPDKSREKAALKQKSQQKAGFFNTGDSYARASVVMRFRALAKTVTCENRNASVRLGTCVADSKRGEANRRKLLFAASHQSRDDTI